MSDKSASVLNCINNMVVELRKLPGGEDLELEETDLADLAEKELLAAAAAIEESAAKLMSRTKRVESVRVYGFPFGLLLMLTRVLCLKRKVSLTPLLMLQEQLLWPRKRWCKLQQ